MGGAVTIHGNHGGLLCFAFLIPYTHYPILITVNTVVTMEILEKNADKSINFQGMMCGNPFVDPFSNTITQVRAFYAHGLLNRPLYLKWEQHCTDPGTYDAMVSQSCVQDAFSRCLFYLNLTFKRCACFNSPITLGVSIYAC